ncbi:MAG: nicotinate phosphoribosyltransferase [Salinisphaeraceae bacterium]|nr:nicotinate phosphoribosyltransferase [Salinisphaeraceae bacterium]
MSVIRQLYGGSQALLADLYQLTMAYAHWREGDPEREAVFHLSFRTAPFNNGFAIACGLDSVIDFLCDLQFSQADLDYLKTLRGAAGQPLFDVGFIDYLARLRFTGRVDALPEGTAVFPDEPLLRVQAPLLQAQLVETALLNLINFPTLVATKAARMAQAAGDQPVVDFGLRKAHGPGAGALAARAAYLGGCAGTANLLAGRLFDIPVQGTHAHSWVMAFDDEADAFDRFARALPDDCIFLVDTYDTMQGVQNAISAGLKLREAGHEMRGIRLDSGDLGALAVQARRMLDEAGFRDALIAASSSLDEQAIASLRAENAPIALWGAGTRLNTAQPDAALDGVYKLSAVRDEQAGAWIGRMKLSDSAGKHSLPGRLQLRRYADCDWLYDIDRGAPVAPGSGYPNQGGPAQPVPGGPGADLLEPVIVDGQAVEPRSTLADARQRALAAFSRFAVRRDHPLLLDGRLEEHRCELARRLAP